MSARLVVALLLIAATTSLAAAQSRPAIPNSAMPGREREQIFGNPNVRPSTALPPPVVTAPQRHKTCRVRGSKKRVRC